MLDWLKIKWYKFLNSIQNRKFFDKLPAKIQDILNQEIPSETLQKQISKDFAEWKGNRNVIKIKTNIESSKTKLNQNQRNFLHFWMANRSESVFDYFEKSIEQKKWFIVKSNDKNYFVKWVDENNFFPYSALNITDKKFGWISWIYILLYKKIEYYQKMYWENRALEELNQNAEFKKFGKISKKDWFIIIETNDDQVFKPNTFDIEKNSGLSKDEKEKILEKKDRSCEFIQDLIQW